MEMEQIPKEDGSAVDFDPRGSRTKSPMGKSLVSRRWKVAKTQGMSKVESNSSSRRKEMWIGRRMETGSSNCIDA